VRRIAGAGLVLLVAGTAVWASVGLVLPAVRSGATASAAPASSADVTTAPVERRSLQTAADLSGALAYEGSAGVAAAQPGTVTRLPAPGTVIRRGDVLYELNGRVRPRLLYGGRPLWRPLGPKVSDGADVLQLEQNLAAMGYAPKGLKVDRHWDAKTTVAVKRWQRAMGQSRDGTLDGGDLAFLPGDIRVASLAAAVGGTVGPGAPVLAATTAHRVVTLDLSASREDLVKAGQAVTITLPDDTTVDGRVRSIGRVATAGQNGSPTTVPVTIDFAAGVKLPDLDAAPVTVHVVTNQHDNVLTVPVNSLVALLEGGYAVEVMAPDGTRRYVGVQLGLFQDGKIEVSGTGISAGDLVVVPR